MANERYNYNAVGSGVDARGFSAISSDTRIAQSWLISEQIFTIQKLYDIGFIRRIPEAVRILFLMTANFHDEKFKATVDIIKRKTHSKADKIFPLKPSDVRVRSENYWRRMEWIRQEFAELLFSELIILFQRKNIVAKKTYSDSELDVDIVDTSGKSLDEIEGSPWQNILDGNL
jgi:hypothetical protein